MQRENTFRKHQPKPGYPSQSARGTRGVDFPNARDIATTASHLPPLHVVFPHDAPDLSVSDLLLRDPLRRSEPHREKRRTAGPPPQETGGLRPSRPLRAPFAPLVVPDSVSTRGIDRRSYPPGGRSSPAADLKRWLAVDRSLVRASSSVSSRGWVTNHDNQALLSFFFPVCSPRWLHGGRPGHPPRKKAYVCRRPGSRPAMPTSNACARRRRGHSSSTRYKYQSPPASKLDTSSEPNEPRLYPRAGSAGVGDTHTQIGIRSPAQSH